MKKLRLLATVAFFVPLAALLLFAVPLSAQAPVAQRVTGKVTAQANGLAVGGATITVKGTKNAVQADDNGDFSIMAAPGEHLLISYVGFTSKDIKLGNATVVNITLSQDIGNLSDVVVVGYGKMKKSDMSAAVGTISNSELNRTVNVTLDDALQGKAANVYVSQTSGAPGAGASVIIRGISTITGNYQPLYVIDGVQIRPQLPTGGAYNVTPNQANELQGLNMDDIADVSLLEGPAATSIYGAAGANGVVMITTKQGKAGLTRVNFTELQSLQTRPKDLPVMNLQQYAIYVNKLNQLGLVPAEPSELSDPSILGPGTDWQHALFQDVWMQKHGLSVSGGGEKNTYYISGDYLNQNGVAIGSGFKRGSVRMNLTTQATKWLRFGINVSAFGTKEISNIFQGNLINVAIGQNPTIPVKNPDGTFGGPAPAQAVYSNTNPVAVATLNQNYNTSYGGIGGVYMDILPVKGLTWHTEANGNMTFNQNYSFNPSYTIGSYVNGTTTGSRGTANNWWGALNTRLQYDYTNGKHQASLMVGHEASEYAYQSLFANAQNWSTNTIQELSAASNIISNPTSGRGDGAQESYIARANYTYDNKYIAQAVFRRDGSSNFGPQNRWGNFPAASLAWKISDEKFMQGISWLNDLKFRFEYGISGNAGQGGAIYSNLYSTSTVWGTGFAPANFANPALQWEQDKSANIGLDAHLFNNRVELIGDVYKKSISNLILPAIGQEFLGGVASGGYGGMITLPIKNYGSMENKGFGITLNTVNIANRDFQWKTGFNFSVDRNKITKLYAPVYNQYYSTTNSRQAEFLTEVGQPLSMITGYIADGLFMNYKDITGHAIQTSNGAMTVSPTQGTWVGDVKFRDINKDGVVDNNDRTIIGNPWPKWTANFNTNFTYKGFELNLFFTGVYGNQILNLTRYQNEYIPLGVGPYANHFASDINFAVPSSLNAADALTATLTNPGHQIPRPSAADANGNARLTQWDVEDGSYIKLKNARLSYSIPSKILQSTHVLRAVTASFQAQNVFTITKYKGYDPEIGMYQYGGLNIVGMDEGRYPQTRSYAFTLSLNF